MASIVVPSEARDMYLPNITNLWFTPNLLLQKLPAPLFTATTKLTLSDTGATTAGLVVFGTDYAFIALRRTGAAISIVSSRVTDAPGTSHEGLVTIDGAPHAVYLRLVCNGTTMTLGYSTDNVHWRDVGEPFTPKPGRWVGAKIGLFALGASGYADFDYFRIH